MATNPKVQARVEAARLIATVRRLIECPQQTVLAFPDDDLLAA